MNNSEHNNNAFLTFPTLKTRGWTEGLVKRFLGQPDKLKSNPRYRAAAPMRLYATERVEAAEASPEFAEALKTSERRTASALKAAQTKRDKLLSKVAAMKVRVSDMSRNRLLHSAIRSYNDYQSERAFNRNHFSFEAASLASDSDFLERIQVNYLRHELSHYDRHLEDVAGRTGVADAVHLIREKVYAAIATTYPEFASECHRQLIARQSVGLAENRAKENMTQSETLS